MKSHVERSKQSGAGAANSSDTSSKSGRLEESRDSKSKLVFGLSSRTNRLKHDEYAEKRRLNQPPGESESGLIESGLEPAGRKMWPAGSKRAEQKKSAADQVQVQVQIQIQAQAQVRPAELRPEERKEDASKAADTQVAASGGGPEPAAGKRRLQFNIPPPRARQSGGAGNKSVVSYAKARIYDRQSSAAASSLLNSSAIPESILSGFKPPKQVNVSKAREKWEGGEPFAKCKSRLRLASQANKRLLHASWSMSSLVASQQLQLQQALANYTNNYNSPADARHSPASTSGVKILSRGSVLERVQQFEKTPALSGLHDQLEPADEAREEPPEARPESPGSRQAAYKSRVSSIQVRAQPPSIAPLSPTGSGAQSPLSSVRRLSLRRRSSSSSNNSTASSIPKFYHPNGKPNTYEIELQKKNIVAAFDKLPDRKALLEGASARRHFHAIAMACAFSEYFKEPLLLYVKHQLTQSNLLHNKSGPARKQSAAHKEPNRRPLIRAASIDTSTMEKLQSQTFISCDQFLVCWRNMISTCFDNAARFVHLLTRGQRNYLTPDDFVPLIQSIIDDHPGLKFLRAAPDFHLRYIQTVIARIYYCANKSWTGKMSLGELRQSNLLAVLQVLSQEEDINQITDYFSYEHFYVIYCKFWNLDQDHDLLISKEDLARHNEAAISSRIIERLFSGVVSKQIQQSGKMSYSDFVWFLMAEEDKKHPRAIEYWFRLMDIDGDGYISMYEMEYFYYEQMKRLELMNIEALPFIDSACQILDLVNPKEKNKISLSDLKRTKMATIFFDTFINLEKYLEHESREFVSTRDVVQDGVVISDWDRYASEEYESLVSEESMV